MKTFEQVSGEAVATPRRSLDVLIYIAGFAIIAAQDWLQKAHSALAIIALEGFSPIAYVYKKFEPTSFSRDFFSGIELYDSSLYMAIYPLGYKYLSIQPETMFFIALAVEYTLVGAALLYLCRSFETSRTAVCVALCLAAVMFASHGKISWARFGYPAFMGQFYNVADALRFFAIGFALRNKPRPAIVAIALSMMVHPVMGLIGAIFVSTIAIINFYQWTRPKVLITAAGMAAAVLTWFKMTMRPESLAGDRIPGEVFVEFGKMNNYHWFPSSLQLFTSNRDEVLYPFLSLVGLLIVATSWIRQVDPKERQTMWAMGAMAATTALGLLISFQSQSATLIKLSLHRSSDLFSMFALFLILRRLLDPRALARPDWIAMAGIGLFTLVTAFQGKAVYPLSGVAAMALLLSFGVAAPSSKWRQQRYVISIPLAILLLLGFSTWKYAMPNLVPTDWSHPVYADLVIVPPLILVTSFVAVSIALVLLLIKRSKWVPIAAATLFVVGSLLWVIRQIPSPDRILLGRDYLEAQNWARTHSDATSLFMTDPTIYYGWRDFSHRSSFGNSREWIHTSWLYSSDRALYEEGLKRFEATGLKIEDFLGKGLAGFDETIPLLRARFYDLSDSWHSDMAKQFGIDYFVFLKERMTSTTGLSVAFENERVVIARASRAP